MYPGETRLFEKETKMYLCKGKLVVGGVDYHEETEITCPPNVIVKSYEHSYIIVIP